MADLGCSPHPASLQQQQYFLWAGAVKIHVEVEQHQYPIKSKVVHLPIGSREIRQPLLETNFGANRKSQVAKAQYSSGLSTGLLFFRRYMK